MERFVETKYPGYSVSDAGSVRGKSGKLLKPYVDWHGYPRINVMSEGKRITVQIHKLICEAFHGPRPTSKHEVAHNDGNPLNARADNLRWATHKENGEDSSKHGVMPRGELQWKAKLTASEVIEIRERHASGESQRSLCKEFGIKASGMSMIINRKNWRHV